jgi:hypothetical protein
MMFEPNDYGDRVHAILALDGAGTKLMPLAGVECTAEEARSVAKGLSPAELFPNARAPECAMAGLYTYLGCFDEAHQLAQDVNTPDGAFWHAILHRREPDAGNSAYWFHRVGRHPIFPALHEAVADLEKKTHKQHLTPASEWDPFAFIDFVEMARRKAGSEQEQFAQQVQLIEWQLLFDHCARPVR